MPGHLLGMVTAPFRCAPPNPRDPQTTAPHIRSASVAVVGPAASPAASRPRPAALLAQSGAKGRPRQSKVRRGLDRFSAFQITINGRSGDASHKVAWRNKLRFTTGACESSSPPLLSTGTCSRRRPQPHRSTASQRPRRRALTPARGRGEPEMGHQANVGFELHIDPSRSTWSGCWS